MSAMSASLIAFDKRVLSEEPLLRESNRGRAAFFVACCDEAVRRLAATVSA